MFITLALFYLTWAPTKAEHQDDNKEHLYDLLPWFFHPHRIALLPDKFAWSSFEAQVRLVFVLVIFNFERFSRALIILTSISLNLKWDFLTLFPITEPSLLKTGIIHDSCWLAGPKVSVLIHLRHPEHLVGLCQVRHGPVGLPKGLDHL